MALSLDGSAKNDTWQQASSGTVTLTTSLTNDVICVLVGGQTNDTYNNGLTFSVSSVTATGLTFTKRVGIDGKGGFNTTGGGNPGLNSLELWTAPSTSALSSKVITVNASNNPDCGCIIAFGVNGVNNINSPWDTNAGLTYSNFSTAQAGSNASVTGVSTTQANDFLIWANETYSSAAPLDSASPPTNFTLIQRIRNVSGNLEASMYAGYRIVSATQASVTVSQTASNSGWIALVDALTADSAGAATKAPPPKRNPMRFFTRRF